MTIGDKLIVIKYGLDMDGKSLCHTYTTDINFYKKLLELHKVEIDNENLTVVKSKEEKLNEKFAKVNITVSPVIEQLEN